MSDKRVFIFTHPNSRRLAHAQCDLAPEGARVVFDYEPPKTNPQERKYHAMIKDISQHCLFLNQSWDAEEWKRLLIDAFVRVMREQAKAENKPDPFGDQGRVVPALDGQGIVQLGIQSRKFSKPVAAQFIEYLYSYGAENNVNWSDEVNW
jgi:hypothetical protein